MGLNDVLSASRNSLRNTSSQLGIVSSNISNANDPNYVRRSIQMHSFGRGGAYCTINRDGNPVLLSNYLSKASVASGYNTLFDGVSRLNSIYNSGEFSDSPYSLMMKFRAELQSFSNNQSHIETANSAVLAAQNLVNSLKNGAQELVKIREDADKDIKGSVDNINNLLHQLEDVEKQIQVTKNDDQTCYSYIDKRDSILKSLSEEIQITVNNNADGSVSIYAANGVTLFDHTARKIDFHPSQSLESGKAGNTIYVDGVPLDHSTFSSPNGGARLGNLLKLRDDIAPAYQRQLDNMAKSLIDIFQKNTDGSPLTNPLFLATNGDTTNIANLANRIQINPTFLAEKGGDAMNLGSKELVDSFIAAFDTPRDYSGNTNLPNKTSLLDFANQSIAWSSSQYQNIKESSQHHMTIYQHAAQSLSNETGVNKDDELALMLQLEQNYGASAKIITAVGKMMDDLLAAVH